ncbi:hypothetical protein BDR04DRAFT_13371 [Suillus decipiens]|nr:hypothetical protein BDR04DRAFT_13371 [Suillus decipiens]
MKASTKFQSFRCRRRVLRCNASDSPIRAHVKTDHTDVTRNSMVVCRPRVGGMQLKPGETKMHEC